MLPRLLASAATLALAGLCIWLFGNARFAAGELAERVAWQKVLTQKERENADLRIEVQRVVARAALDFANRLSAIEPIVVRSTDTVTRFASTPPGGGACLASDRVRGIEADAALLGFAAAARSEQAAVREDTAPGE